VDIDEHHNRGDDGGPRARVKPGNSSCVGGRNNSSGTASPSIISGDNNAELVRPLASQAVVRGGLVGVIVEFRGTRPTR